MIQTIKQICICGAGTMGSGIAQLTAQGGYKTILYDVDLQMIGKAKILIENNLSNLVSKNKITGDEKSRITSSLHFTNNIQECIADVIVEAIIENLDAKLALFNQLEKINSDKTILATNTSSLSVSTLAEKTS